MRNILLVCLLCLMPAVAMAADELRVENGQVRQPMPGKTVTAGYFTLINSSDTARSLVSVHSPAFARAELHQHSHKDGMMRMEQVEQISVAAKSSVTLAPGGLHLMLFQPQTELKAGQMIALQLQFADGTELSVSLPIVAMPKR